MSAWKTMESAPQDRAIWARENSRHYEAKMAWNGHEWECVSFQGTLMGIGFYPTHWCDLPAPPLPGESNARFIAGPATPSKR